ncbi:MAG: DUF1501 domain-containing protein [Planctomycetes bacterium]|nr:DUF1501 domain-containing protein [Planctomycetota bacterium]
MQRRRFLKFGLAGAGGLSLPALLQLRAAAHEKPRERTAIILMYCHGGISHIDTWDPKPEAPTEIRGPFQPIETRVPGMQITELLPRHAAIADKFSLLRSLSHEASCHANGPKRLFSGHFTLNQDFKPEHPDCLAIANYLRWQRGRSIPNYVGMTTYGLEPGPVSAIGPAYLGEKYSPLAIFGDPNKQNTLGGLVVDTNGQLARRGELRGQLDRSPLRDAGPELLNEFHQQAFDILCRPDAQRAFNLELEPAAVRDRYGRTSWGQHCLLARRLVESGVDLVTVTLCGAEAGGAGNNWDDHAVNCDIFAALKKRSENFDRCVTTLISDIFERGLNERVMVVVTSEFGRTPRINRQVGSQTKIEQPGRDHWPQAMSILFAGGGTRGGQVIGATNRFGEHPIDRKFGPWNFIATIYQHLGIDAKNLTVPDLSGRPMPILPEGEPIPELVSLS